MDAGPPPAEVRYRAIIFAIFITNAPGGTDEARRSAALLARALRICLCFLSNRVFIYNCYIDDASPPDWKGSMLAPRRKRVCSASPRSFPLSPSLTSLLILPQSTPDITEPMICTFLP